MASDFFNINKDFTTSPLVQNMLMEGEIASKKAAAGVKKGLASKGFGGSTFVDPLITQSSAIAYKPYLDAGTNLAETLKRQNIADFFTAKAQEDSRRQFDQSLSERVRQFDFLGEEREQERLLEEKLRKEEEDRRNSQNFFSKLLSGGSALASVFGGPLAGLATDFFGKQLVGNTASRDAGEAYSLATGRS